MTMSRQRRDYMVNVARNFSALGLGVALMIMGENLQSSDREWFVSATTLGIYVVILLILAIVVRAVLFDGYGLQAVSPRVEISLSRKLRLLFSGAVLIPVFSILVLQDLGTTTDGSRRVKCVAFAAGIAALGLLQAFRVSQTVKRSSATAGPTDPQGSGDAG